MLELLYIGRFDYLARPNAPDSDFVPNDCDVAISIATADQAASEDRRDVAQCSQRRP